MIIEEIKKATVQAMKDKDANLRSIYSVVINKYMLATVEARTTGKEVDDAQMVKIIQKTIKELEEEKANYERVGHTETANNIAVQKAVLEKYLPQLLSEEEIKKIILSLDDKTVPAVMRHFKSNYNGQVDMKTVSDVLKTL
ncbi:MAG: GatB/YqeY domain-containing protein [Clostridia bacterium]|nr:GatB/YqeY domain-containing protein [Clostridia bacterium]